MYCSDSDGVMSKVIRIVGDLPQAGIVYAKYLYKGSALKAPISAIKFLLCFMNITQAKLLVPRVPLFLQIGFHQRNSMLLIFNDLSQCLVWNRAGKAAVLEGDGPILFIITEKVQQSVMAVKLIQQCRQL